MITVEILGAKALINQFQRARRELGKRMRAATRETAKNIRRQARRNLASNKTSSSQAGNFTRDTAKSIRYQMQGTTALLTVGFPGHIIERGTQPFFPPPSVLEGWAGSKLGNPQAAFVVARHIAEVGLPASPFLAPAVDKERAPHAKRINKALLGMELFRG